MSPVSSNGAPRAGAAKWEEYLQFCNEHALANWWFRGVTDSTYSLLPKIGRGHEREKWTVPVGKSTRATPEDRERRVFEAFRRRAHLELQVRPESDLEWLALAQHHGVPTRLLDWTTNPLMAAWFATDKSDPPDDRIARVHAVRVTSKLAVENVALDPFKMTGRSPVFVVAPHWHPRVRAQRGCFSVHPVPNEALDIKHDHFDIGASHWREFRRRLFYFGVDASTVMADLSGLGQALDWQYRHSIGIGDVGY